MTASGKHMQRARGLARGDFGPANLQDYEIERLAEIFDEIEQAGQLAGRVIERARCLAIADDMATGESRTSVERAIGATIAKRMREGRA